MEEQIEASGGELLAEIRNGIAKVTLNRPPALNALTFGMIRGLATWLDEWEQDDRVRVIVLRGAGEKAFCAGGDVRSLYNGAKAGEPRLLDFFVAEYALDFRIHAYAKPIVAVIDGIVMGGGMGIAQGSGFRLVGPKTKMAMPETAIGLFPDVGGSYFLSRSPVGLYLGLTGKTFRAADALFANLADRYMSAERFFELQARLDRLLWTGDSGKDVARLIDAVTTVPDEPSTLAPMRDAIEQHIRFDRTVPEILASLKAETRADWRDWATEAATTLEKRSPVMLCVTHEQLKRGRTLALADCFRMELGIVRACFEHGDLLEGIRAAVIDKDGKPRWNPSTLAEVTEERVAAFFHAADRLAEDHPLTHLEKRFG